MVDAAATIAQPRIEELPAGLDWVAFSARSFPARGFPHGRRHDFKAVSVYFAYKQRPGKAAENKTTAEAVEAWEGEGGSTRPLDQTGLGVRAHLSAAPALSHVRRGSATRIVATPSSSTSTT